jgi:hypothetical protein
MFVVCDTNVFVRDTHLLRKKGGPQFIRLLRAIQGRLLVPDILRQEYIEQTRQAAIDAHTRMVNARSVLESLTGSSSPESVLDVTVVDRRTLARLDVLEPCVHRIPLTDELRATAGQRSIDKRRPVSKTDHGYKDCLIWESILKLPADTEVRFISRDNKGFYEGHNLAPDLAAEARGRGLRVLAFRELEQVVRELEANNPSLDYAALSALDLVEPATGALDRDSWSLASDEVPRRLPVDGGSGITQGSDWVGGRLDEAQQLIQDQEKRVLGYIAYFGDASKSQLFEALAQTGLTVERAQNIAERLSLVGLVQDTGHHYLVPDRELAQAAAGLVEADIIGLLGRGR